MKIRTKRLLIIEGAFVFTLLFIYGVLWWSYRSDYTKDVLIQDAPKTSYRYDDRPVKTRECLAPKQKQDLIQQAMREWIKEWNGKGGSRVQ